MAELSRTQLGLLVQELQRRQASDPLHAFRPTPPQAKFIRSVLYGEYPENYYLGANRSGKTLAEAYIGSYLLRFGFPDDSPLAARYVRGQDSAIEVRDRATSGWMSSLDFPMSRDVIQPYMFQNGFGAPSVHPFIPDWEIEDWSVSNQVLRLKNGSVCGFKSADSKRKKYQGAGKDWIGFDEEHPEDIVEEATIRVGKNPLILFTAATLLPPEGTVGGVTWLYPKVIVPWKKGELPKVGIYTSSIYENPHIPLSEIERLEAKYAAGSLQRKIRMEGELLPGLGGARLYSSFEYERNCRAAGELLPMMPLAMCWDFNVEPMPVVVGQRRGGVFYVHKELILEEGNLQLMCEDFTKEYPAHPGGVILYGDASGHDRTVGGGGKSNWTLVMQALSRYPTGVRMRVPFLNPAVTDRINAVNVACRGVDQMARLVVSPECVELLADMDGVVSDGRGGIKKSRRRGEPYYRRTHFSDALGYWIVQEAPVGSAAASEAVTTWSGGGGGSTYGSRPSVPRPGYGWLGGR